MKILIIRFSSIGDIVLTTALIRCIKQQMPPGTQVDFLTKKSFGSLLEGNMHLTKVHLLDGNIKPLLQQLKKEGYSKVVDLHNNLRSLRVKRALGVQDYTFSKLNVQKWLLVKLKINRMPKVHIVDRCFNAVKDLGISNDNMGLDLFLSEEEVSEGIEHFNLQAKTYVAIALGAAHTTKQIPLVKLLELIGNINFPIVLLGGKTDETLAKQLMTQSSKSLLNACGKFSIKASAGLVKNAKLLISPDTGLMHIAAALNTPIYAVWGNTVPEFGMYPYTKAPYVLKEVKGLSCRPCSKIGHEKCPKGHFNCMMKQDFSTISEEIKTLLNFK